MNQRFRVLQELGEQFERVSAETVAAGGVRARRGRRWRPLSFVALAAVLLAGSAAAAVSLVGRGSAPVHTPTGGAICPLDTPYMADASRKLFYPPNYPETTIRTSIHSVSCFASAWAASHAGYRIAPLPAGDGRLGRLYTEPTPASMRRLCRTAQSRTRSVVHCPTRLPAPWLVPTFSCPSSTCDAPLLSFYGSFSAPQSYIGSAAGLGDLIVWAASAGQLHRDRQLAGCLGSPTHLVSRVTFEGRPAAWYRCHPLGIDTSMLEWQIGGEHYGVGADGPPAMRQRLIEYVAAHMIPQR